MNKLNVAVIGCGSWGRNHARVYNELPNVKLAAVCDARESTAKEIGMLYNVPFHSDPYKVIDDSSIDVINICTPTVTHAELALAAIKNGKHVLVEKPMTNTLEEAIELIKAATNKKIQMTIGFVERFNPAVQQAYNVVNQKELGEVILVHTRRVSRRPLRIGDVGVIKDLAIHDIDIVNHLFVDDPITVSAYAGNISHTFEDYASINLAYSGNRSAFVETNWLTPRKIRTCTITCTEGIINVDYANQEISIENYDQIIQPFLVYKEPLHQELKSFTEAIQNGTIPEVTSIDGFKALQVCVAALESNETGKRIKIKPLVDLLPSEAIELRPNGQANGRAIKEIN
jgi:UDP-N-acetylglucosamine 3-dehydrogenase